MRLLHLAHMCSRKHPHAQRLHLSCAQVTSHALRELHDEGNARVAAGASDREQLVADLLGALQVWYKHTMHARAT